MRGGYRPNSGAKKGNIPWNKGLKLDKDKYSKMGFQKGHKCFDGCEKSWFTTERVLGTKNTNWKGDDVGYFSVHGWIRRHYGIPKKCDFCNTDKKTIWWANKSGKYKRDRNDWFTLCQKCHWQYDEPWLKINRDEFGRFTSREVK